jgi:hypothetical protein
VGRSPPPDLAFPFSYFADLPSTDAKVDFLERAKQAGYFIRVPIEKIVRRLRKVYACCRSGYPTASPQSNATVKFVDLRGG